MKKYFSICILLLLLLCLGGCGDDAPEEGKRREPIGSVSPAATPTGAERFTPTPFRTEPTKEPTKAPTPTATVQYFNWDLTESEEIAASETLRVQWGEPTYWGHIIADAFCLAVWEENPNWMENPSEECPWADVCHVYFTSWEDCEFYLFVPGYQLEDGRTGYMKVSKEQFLAFVQSLTRDVEQWVDSGIVTYDNKAPFGVWVENGKVIRLAEAYMP